MSPFAFTSLAEIRIGYWRTALGLCRAHVTGVDGLIVSYVADENAHINRGIGKVLEKLIASSRLR